MFQTLQHAALFAESSIITICNHLDILLLLLRVEKKPSIHKSYEEHVCNLSTLCCYTNTQWYVHAEVESEMPGRASSTKEHRSGEINRYRRLRLLLWTNHLLYLADTVCRLPGLTRNAMRD